MSALPNITNLGDGEVLWASTLTTSGGVTSINTLSGALTIAAGTGVSISNAGNHIVLSNTGVLSVASGNSNVSITGTPQIPIVSYTGAGAIKSIYTGNLQPWIYPAVQVGSDLTWSSAPFTPPSTGNYIVQTRLSLASDRITPSLLTSVYIKLVDQNANILATNFQYYATMPNMFGNSGQLQAYTLCAILALSAGTVYQAEYTFTNATNGTATTGGSGASYSLVALE
jgi:hypothetical protein